MKQIFLICFSVSCQVLAFGQTGKITGTVMDAEFKVPLELATVVILGEDSSVIAYQLSDKNGLFSIEKLPLKKKLLVGITYTGYMGYNLSVQFDSSETDTLTVFLEQNIEDSNAVIVTAAIPIRMNGDTLEINPAAFKMKEDAVVEELLNQVSGVTIWSDGTITVNGRKVNNLLVDGKPFMGSTDSRVATQNLPKSAIDKIQLYQEYDRTAIGQERKPQDSLLTMNLKLKENSKKGYFGKAGAGYGTMDRFESDLSLQTYTKKSSAGIGGGINNINKGLGNIEQIFQNNTYRNYNPNLYNAGRFGANGINRNYSIGGMFQHNFIESANSMQNNRLSTNYTSLGTNAYITDTRLQNRTTIENQQFIREEGVQNNRQNRHNLGINYIKTNNYNDNLNLIGAINTDNDSAASFRYAEVRDSANQLQSTNLTNSIRNQRSDNQSLNISYGKSNTDEQLKNFNGHINAARGNTKSQNTIISAFESLKDNSENTYNNRRYITNNQSLNISGNLNYSGFKRLLLGRYNLFGINLSLSQQLKYSSESYNSLVSDYDSSAGRYSDNNNLSNENKRELLEYTPSLMFSKSFYKYTGILYRNISIQFHLMEDLITDKNMSSLSKRNLDRSFQFFRYQGNLSLNYQKSNKYQYNSSLNYSRQMEYPSVNELFTLVDDINAYDIRIGNPNLDNSTNHSINLNAGYFSMAPNSLYTVNGNFNGSYNLSLDPVTDSIINDFSGKRIYYYTNAEKSNSLFMYYNFNISRKFNKNSLQLMYNGSYRNNINPNYIDGISNISEIDGMSNQINLQYTHRTILTITAGHALQQDRSKTSAPGLNSFKANRNTTKMGLVLNYPTNFIFSSTLDHIANSNLDKPIMLWNSFVTYRFMKQQGELKFSAMDILRQYQNILNTANSYGTTTTITNGLQQYFILTFSYYPRKFGKTEIKRQSEY